ncbi:hypothetical protein [Olsenella sp. HMSC062G07]|uniref:hypothetical protein n=1 Tax=Olsenella sp. HMSC062G07 TaxID=1739330 RepID=UPI0008A303FD|nr:hypothetical protein [Olsenella sp. HMSC062G07]OFK25016.1 hypothetical protein HMPREF2826_00365 [Olsenella sp. HMSC062G07]
MNRYVCTISNEEKTEDITLTELCRWDALDASQEIPASPSRGAKSDYLWVYFDIKRLGKLAEYGIDEDVPPLEAIRTLAEGYGIEVSKVEKAAAPLASAPAK